MSYRWFLLLLAWVVSLNLRSGIVAVAPLLPLIRTDLGLTYAQAGLLMAVPVAAWAATAWPAGRLADRWGSIPVVSLGLTLLVVGAALRTVVGSYYALQTVTLIFGAGVGIAQTAMPSLVQEWFRDQAATATGIYVNGLLTGSTVAAAISGTYLLRWAGNWGWRGSLFAWAILGIASLVLWLTLTRSSRSPGRPRNPGILAARGAGHAPSGWPPDATSWLRNRTAWLIAAFFGCQSLVFWIVNSWLISYYMERGWPLERASVLLAILQLVHLPWGILVAYASDRMGRRRPLIVATAALLIVAHAGLLWWPDAAAALWALLFGVGLCTTFVLGLALPGDLVQGPRVGSLVGMVLTVAYAVSTVGPFVAGLLRDQLGTLSAGFVFSLLLSVVLLGLTLLLPETARVRMLAARKSAHRER